MAKVWAAFLAAQAIGTVAAFAGSLTVTGKTDAGSQSFVRRNENGTNSSTSVKFSAFSFNIPGNTTCSIEGGQDYDGFLSLYRNSFNPGSPATNHVIGDDDDPFIGTRGSQIADIDLTSGNYILVNSAFSSGTGNFQSIIRCENQPLQAPCNGFVITGVPVERTACLLNRFVVAIDSVSSSPTAGFATPVRMATSDSALFWFYDERNIEVVVKAIDACGFNNRYWIFAGALTDQQYRILIGDTLNPGLGLRTYFHGIGTPAPSVTDTNAFATCP
jgi:hypothetical protein